jgi:hypothetical protein
MMKAIICSLCFFFATSSSRSETAGVPTRQRRLERLNATMNARIIQQNVNV